MGGRAKAKDSFSCITMHCLAVAFVSLLSSSLQF